MKNDNNTKLAGAAVLLGIILTILTIIDKVINLNLFHALSIDPSLTTEVLNIITLVCFYIILKPHDYELTDKAMVELAESLKVEDKDYETLKYNNVRVNKIIRQLVKNLKWFMAILFLFYCVNLLKDADAKLYHKLNDTIPFVDFAETLTNAVSAAFIYFAFTTLYETTLDSKNQESDYHRGTVVFLVLFLGIYVVLLSAFDDVKNVSNVFKLMCGMYNGLAMGLLFGRITAMEYYFKDINLSTNKLSKVVYQIGILFFMPMYVLAQPMYGILEFPYFNISDVAWFKPIVFLVCFIGKAFFLLLISNYINFRWLHVYLHLVLANQEVPKKIMNLGIMEKEAPADGAVAPVVTMEVISPYLFRIEGEYEYVCTQRKSEHSHGGVCQISALSNFHNIVEWKLQGERRWSKSNAREVQHFANPFAWETVKGVLFKDKSYLYFYQIVTDEGTYLGLSRGYVTLSPDNKDILELKGTYYQQSGNDIVWGNETIKRKTNSAVESIMAVAG